jgi:hypothetical protein
MCTEVRRVMNLVTELSVWIARSRSFKKLALYGLLTC